MCMHACIHGGLALAGACMQVLEFEDGRVRLAFCARTEVRSGQELTYDYRFKEEGVDAKMACGCGAPNCRGTLN